MTSHVVTLQPPWDGTCIFICCSCSDEPIAKVGFPEAAASLVEINHIAHEHIEAAEGRIPAFAPLRPMTAMLDPFFDGVRQQLQRDSRLG